MSGQLIGHVAVRQAEHPILSVKSDQGAHLMACGLIGEPVPPVMMSGGPQKKNS
jgi:hypothetical protein